MKPGIELTLLQQREVVNVLRATLEKTHSETVNLIETHISFVLVGSEFAYKFKKVIKTGFLDQSCLTARLQACREELRLNRRLAPKLYLDVVPVTRGVNAPRFGGDELMIDFAVKMRAFAQENLWDALARQSALRPAHVDDLLTQLLAFHACAARAPATGRLGSPGQIHALALENFGELERLAPGILEHESLQHLRGWEADSFGQVESLQARRLAQGQVRECHGDLHLGNVAQIDGHATVFDGIDFSEEYRTIDVMSDVAFLAMDLHAHGLPGLARRFVNGYIEASGDYEGVPLLNYYMVYRALVRSKVAMLRAVQPRARERALSKATPDESLRTKDLAEHYLAVAQGFTRTSRPVLLITHGYSGSGKSTLTQGLIEATGAIRIRSDVERKRLAGQSAVPGAAEVWRAGLYGRDMTAATYERLRRLARLMLQSGRSVILDATFLQRAERQAARQLAAEMGLAFGILDFDAPLDTLRDRLVQRARQGHNASDADLAVLEQQIKLAEPLTAAGRASACFVPQAGDPSAEAGLVNWSKVLGRFPGLVPN